MANNNAGMEIQEAPQKVRISVKEVAAKANEAVRAAQAEARAAEARAHAAEAAAAEKDQAVAANEAPAAPAAQEEARAAANLKKTVELYERLCRDGPLQQQIRPATLHPRQHPCSRRDAGGPRRWQPVGRRLSSGPRKVTSGLRYLRPRRLQRHQLQIHVVIEFTTLHPVPGGASANLRAVCVT